ncbi:formylmethanofuran dehydrogenase, subunit A [Arboricoccus pini]|uniref:Formylmethanofuran dehydrogenase, subunit A n=1 Tax=Arboricoccus pini TaxID=1963835 RepID=A0A212S054_9PROT|nr:formylmethanofuran dehydrogenase subunit A [Arboricoccus pini]SNB78416.1 formylmethanofuran dehydrogenase, subunit A [Arboricoccus pini]
MLTKLAGGRVFDPINDVDGEVKDLFIEDGRFVEAHAGKTPDEVRDLSGKVLMAGGIDMHSHIGGGKFNIARMLMADEHRNQVFHENGACRCGSGEATPSTFQTGYAYAKLGYTMAFEPAMLPANARQAHLEMGDIPILDKGAYALLGSDDLLLSMMREEKGKDAIRDYVAWTLETSQALAIKVVNPGGISAFKWGARRLNLDEKNPYYEQTPRKILTTLADALTELGVPHPVHVHGCNLGVPGNDETTLKTIEGMEGRRIHLTHLQFHSYGKEGKRGFSSGAAAIAEAVNKNKNVSIDVGQVMFGQTVTASGDTMSQVRTSRFADPKKWVAMDIECDAGCGVLPFRYKEKNFVHALQWAIGLELFLMIEDPWQIFLTTDHPNGAPFTTYPHLIRLLMDRDFRNDRLRALPKATREMSNLESLTREYTLAEIATITRAGPARILGLDKEHGHLGAGARADLTAYRDDPDREAMFNEPELVLKAGRRVVEKGVIDPEAAGIVGATHVVRPGYDRLIERHIGRFVEDFRGMRLGTVKLSDAEIEADGKGSLVCHACGGVH